MCKFPTLKQVWEVGTFHKEEWKNVANVFNCKLPTSSKFEKDSTDNNLLSKKIKRHHIFSFPATPRLLGTPTFRTEKGRHNPNELVLIPQYATRSNQRNIVSESWRTSENLYSTFARIRARPLGAPISAPCHPSWYHSFNKSTSTAASLCLFVCLLSQVFYFPPLAIK